MADWKIIHLDETDSTNRWLRSEIPNSLEQIPIAVWADYQTAGRGCGANKWESERGKNLTFSILIHPGNLPATRQFDISMAISLAICEALGQHLLQPESRNVASNGDLSIKWPNDIYWRNGKIAGILIEHTLHGNVITNSIIGVGLNVNQRVFHSDAPNPVSLWQICKHETDREQLLHDILCAFERYLGQNIHDQYLGMLYHRSGFYPYRDQDGTFIAELVTIAPDGHLLLRDDNGQQRRYAFKEVSFV